MSKKIKEKEVQKKKTTILPAVAAVVLLGLMIVLLSLITRFRENHKKASVKLGDYKALSIELPEGFDDLSESEKEEELDRRVLEALLSVCKFSHIDNEVKKRYNENMKYYAQMVVLYDQYETITDLATQYYGYADLESFEENVMDYSELSIKQELALDAVAKKEGLNVDDAVFEKYIGKYLAAYDYKENEREEFLKNYGRDTVYEIILRDYTLDTIKVINNI